MINADLKFLFINSYREDGLMREHYMRLVNVGIRHKDGYFTPCETSTLYRADQTRAICEFLGYFSLPIRAGMPKYTNVFRELVIITGFHNTKGITARRLPG